MFKEMKKLKLLASLTALMIVLFSIGVAQGGARWSGIDPEVLINGEKFNDQDGLIGYLKGRAAQAGKSADGIASELAVKIRADGHCEYMKVQRVMVACMKAGIAKVAFGAAPKDPK